MKTLTANFRLVKMHILVLAATICLCFLSSGSPAIANSRIDFTLYNETGGTIENVYCTAGSADYWGTDILGTSYLYNGYNIDVVFQDNTSDTDIDLKLVDTDGNSHIFYNVPSTTFNKLYVKKNENGNWYYTTSD